MKNKKKVDILMATYNGEKYLLEQIDSILNQSYKYFNLIISDDLSTDKTLDILKSYKEKNIKIIQNKKNKGHCYNFLNLLKYSNADYVMFADQDDIWEITKVEETLKYMSEKEKENIDAKILIHTEQKLIDSRGDYISNNLTTYFERKLIFKNFNELGFRGGIYGCTMMLNKKLVDYLKEKKIWQIKGLFYHDWSIAMITYKIGKIYFYEKATMRYRLHENNVSIKKRKLISELFRHQKRKENLYKTYLQYDTVLTIVGEKDILKFATLSYFKRILVNYRVGFWKYEKNYLKKVIKLLEV